MYTIPPRSTQTPSRQRFPRVFHSTRSVPYRVSTELIDNITSERGRRRILLFPHVIPIRSLRGGEEKRYRMGMV